MGLALDEPNATDASFDVDGMTWIVARDVEPMIMVGKGVRVERYDGGFYVARNYGGGRREGCC